MGEVTLRMDGGVISGALGTELGPEVMVALGRRLGAQGQVALGGFGGTGAQMLLRAAAAGITAAGAMVFYHHMTCAAQAAWLGESHQFPMSLFVEQEGERANLYLFDRWGLPLDREGLRSLGDSTTVAGRGVGGCEMLATGVGEYVTDGARRAALHRHLLRRLCVAVPGESPADRGMARMLEHMGCRVVDQWSKGLPEFRVSRGGFSLTARDESGAQLSARQLLAAVALVELENGGGRLAAPDEATAALELIAAGFDKTVLRLGRDGEEARRIYSALPWFRDAAFAAARLCARMAVGGERLEQLCDKTPRFSGWKREVELQADGGAAIGEIARRAGRELSANGGVRLRGRGGWVYLAPLTGRRAVKVVAEGPDPELAAELCDFYVEQLAQLDGPPTK